VSWTLFELLVREGVTGRVVVKECRYPGSYGPIVLKELGGACEVLGLVVGAGLGRVKLSTKGADQYESLVVLPLP